MKKLTNENRLKRDEKRYIQIGLKIAYYRKLNLYTQEQFAELIDLSPKYISRIETASTPQPISLTTLFAIADVLEIEPAKLLNFDD